MKSGPWHQFGDRSQRLALEQLEHGAGVGVILSPRDLSFSKAAEYADEYRDLGAEIVIDPPFYIPHFSNDNLISYPTSDYRTSVSALQRIGDAELSNLATQIREMNQEIGVDAVIAPAVAYQARNRGIADLNARLFSAGKAAGDALGVQTYATVVIGRSNIASVQAIDEALSYATGLASDGWYFTFEFEPERIPSSREAVYRCCRAGLTLACTGKPVMHAYAGPLALLSYSFGATAAGIGYSQNVWRFSPSRWQPVTGQGGGGDAPPRFFSGNLWGTIVHPDETAQLPADVASQVFTSSPFVGDGSSPPDDWSRWNSNKHLVFTICKSVASQDADNDPREISANVQRKLRRALRLYRRISEAGVPLRDSTDAYHANWFGALDDLLTRHDDQFEFLSLL